MLDLPTLMLDGLARSKSVFRFQGVRCNNRENVAEHSFFTTLYAMLICEEYALPSEVSYSILKRSLLHDMEEIHTGDIPSPFKRKIEKAMNLDTIGCHAFDLLFEKCDDRLKHKMRVSWIHRREGTEGYVVKLADYMAALAFLAEEVRSGNSSITKQLLTFKNYAKRFDSAGYDPYRNLINQLKTFAERYVFYAETN